IDCTGEKEATQLKVDLQTKVSPELARFFDKVFEHKVEVVKEPAPETTTPPNTGFPPGMQPPPGFPPGVQPGFPPVQPQPGFPPVQPPPAVQPLQPPGVQPGFPPVQPQPGF